VSVERERLGELRHREPAHGSAAKTRDRHTDLEPDVGSADGRRPEIAFIDEVRTHRSDRNAVGPEDADLRSWRKLHAGEKKAYVVRFVDMESSRPADAAVDRSVQ